jgi:hypothetical protein
MRSSVLFAAIIAIGIAALPKAHAYTQKEADVLLNVSYAIATAGHKNRKGAEAFCRQAKGMLTKKREDAYLFAHIERCFGEVASAFKDTKTACKHYKRALDIWQRTPPPNDHPQSVASRERLRDSMLRYRKENCGAS